MFGKEEVKVFLKEKGIPFHWVEHKAVYTIEEMEELGLEKMEETAKNLFLRDQKGKCHFLVVIRADKQVNLKELGEKLGGTRQTFGGLAGMGDLIVTCTSMHSRNRRAGILIGQGKSAQEAMAEVGAVVEGYYATASAHQLAEKYGIEMPIADAAYQVLYGDGNVQEAIGGLMRRQKRHEIDEIWLEG